MNIEQIALEVANGMPRGFIWFEGCGWEAGIIDKEVIEFATRFLARIDAERSKEGFTPKFVWGAGYHAGVPYTGNGADTRTVFYDINEANKYIAELELKLERSAAQNSLTTNPTPTNGAKDISDTGYDSRERPAMNDLGIEPFGVWHQGDTEDESDFFLGDAIDGTCCDYCTPLYSHTDVARRIGELTQQHDKLLSALKEIEQEGIRYKESPFDAFMRCKHKANVALEASK